MFLTEILAHGRNLRAKFVQLLVELGREFQRMKNLLGEHRFAGWLGEHCPGLPPAEVTRLIGRAVAAEAAPGK